VRVVLEVPKSAPLEFFGVARRERGTVAPLFSAFPFPVVWCVDARRVSFVDCSLHCSQEWPGCNTHHPLPILRGRFICVLQHTSLLAVSSTYPVTQVNPEKSAHSRGPARPAVLLNLSSHLTPQRG